MLSSLSWVATMLVCFLMFTCGVMAAQAYNPVSLYLKANSLAVNDLGNIRLIQEQNLKICTISA
jgi:hypothetical protein